MSAISRHHVSVLKQAIQRRIELFGPAGLRSFVRQNMKMTFTRTSNNYVVHELLKPEDRITPCDTAPLDSSARMNFAEMNVMHYSELRGSDIRASSDGLWRKITYGKGRMSTIQVDAGPILHRGNDHGLIINYHALTGEGHSRSLYRVCLHRITASSQETCYPRRHLRPFCDRAIVLQPISVTAYSRSYRFAYLATC